MFGSHSDALEQVGDGCAGDEAFIKRCDLYRNTSCGDIVDVASRRDESRA
jgi:hypothetical protein